MEQALCRRHAEQRAHFAGAAGLAEDRDAPGIAAEARDVVAHPLEAGDDVLLSRVAGAGETLVAELGEMDETEDVEAVRDADDHHVVASRQVGAVIRQRCRRSAGISAAVQPDHHRARAAGCRARRPDVEVQTVFAHRFGAGERLPLGHERREHLRGARAEGERLADAGPRRGRHRRQKSPRAGGRCAVRDRLEHLHAVDPQAAHASGRRLDDGAGRAGRRLRQRSRAIGKNCDAGDRRLLQKLPPVHSAGPYHESEFNSEFQLRVSTPTSSLARHPSGAPVRSHG
jgi:hypothetical protein